VASKFDNVVDAVKSTRLEVYRIPYDPTKLNSSINPTGMGIRRTTENAAQRAKDAVGAGSGGVYGTRVHTAFEKEIKALGNANLSTEVSYKNGTPVSRGTNGSVAAHFRLGFRRIERFVTRSSCLTLHHNKSIRGI